MYTPLFILNVFNNFLESELCFMCLERVERDIAHRINLKHSKVVCNLRIISKLKVETEFKISYKWTHITYCDHAHTFTHFIIYIINKQNILLYTYFVVLIIFTFIPVKVLHTWVEAGRTLLDFSHTFAGGNVCDIIGKNLFIQKQTKTAGKGILKSSIILNLKIWALLLIIIISLFDCVSIIKDNIQ